MQSRTEELEKLKQEVALLREQLVRSDMKMLTCLIQAEAKILACQTELATFQNEFKKEIAKSSADRKLRHDIMVEEMNKLWKNSQVLDNAIVEIHMFLWPVVEKIFPKLMTKYAAISERFKPKGHYSEAKKD